MMHSPPNELRRPGGQTGSAAKLKHQPDHYSESTAVPQIEDPLDRLTRRLENERLRIIAEMADENGAGLPDLRRLDNLASLEMALQSIRRCWDARP